MYSDLSIKHVRELAQMAQTANGTKDAVETALIKSMERAANFGQYADIEYVLTLPLSDRVTLKALDLYAKAPMASRDVFVDLYNRTPEPSQRVRAAVLDKLADRTLLLTLQSLAHEGVPKPLQHAMNRAIRKCEVLCLQKNHVHSLATFRSNHMARKAGSSGLVRAYA